MFLITTDIHLTERPQDEYRWGLFPWLEKQIEEYGVDNLFILGDLTDQKDRHTGSFINRIVENILKLSKKTNVFILCGNHDYIDKHTPTFKFLSFMRAMGGRDIGPKFIWQISQNKLIENYNVCFLPHSRNPEKDWEKVKFKEHDIIFMHQTVAGAKASNGYTMEGMPPDFFKTDAWIFSGDIHVPQKIGPVIYIGSPYHVRFGDAYEPRVALFDGREIVDLHYPCIRKRVCTVRDPITLTKMDLRPGDQVKVILNLPKVTIHEWPTFKSYIVEMCEDLKVELQGVELRVIERKKIKEEKRKAHGLLSENKKEVFDSFCAKKEIKGDLKKHGELFVNKVEETIGKAS